MTLDKLWQDISFIYNNLNYKTNGRKSYTLLVYDLMITSFDNRYELYYRPYGRSIHIRIYKNYNLVSMWSGHLDSNVTYNIDIDVSGTHYELAEIEKIEFVYNIIRVYLREAKLKEIGL